MELTSVKNIKSLAAMFGFDFSKGLGQNFLTNPDVLDSIAAAACGTEGVLEIGPGFGVLTKKLAQSFEKVVTVELDKSLLPVLDYTLSDFDNVKIINADFMKLDLNDVLKNEFDLKKISVAANLPYYITTPIITSLIEGRYSIDNIVVMVQKEVAERFCADPGTKEYGAISVLCRYYTVPEIICTVPSCDFYPSPKVDSAVVRLKVSDKPNTFTHDEKLFFKVVKASFAQRRKTLHNCLSNGLKLDKKTAGDVLAQAGIEPSVRGEKLGIDEFAAIANTLHEIGIK